MRDALTDAGLPPNRRSRMTQRAYSPGRSRAFAVCLGLASGALAAAGCDDPISRERPQPAIGGVEEVFRAPVAGATNAFALTSDGVRLYADVDRRIEAFDLKNGAKLWSYRRPVGGPLALVVRGGRLFFVGDTAVALDAATGRELWRYVPDSYSGFTHSDADLDAFYFGSTQHRVYAVRASDGSLLWSRDLGPDWPYKGVVRGMTVSGDTVYAVVEHDTGVNGYIGTGDVFALDRRTGAVHWVFRNGDGTRLNIIQYAGRVAGNLLLLSANWDNQYIALDRATGREVWRAAGEPTYAGLGEGPEVEGAVAYIASYDQHAMAVDLATGRTRWRTNIGDGGRYVAVCGTRLLVNQLGFTVLDRNNGRLLGEGYDHASGEDIHTDFVVVGDRAYAFGGKELFAFRCPT
jgi:outer membrane protein assembly factor BamB